VAQLAPRRRALNVFHLDAEVENTFAPVARRQQGQIDMAIRDVDGFAVVAAARDFFKAEGVLVKLRKFRRLGGENGDMCDPCMVSPPL
jgi:hypothetical protein